MLGERLRGLWAQTQRGVRKQGPAHAPCPQEGGARGQDITCFLPCPVDSLLLSPLK